MLNIPKHINLFSPGFSPGIKPVFFIFNLLFFFYTTAQQNLVPNGSFEEYSECPQSNELNNGQFERAVGWWRPTYGTPDYYNRCSNGIVSVPNNFWGYQEPFHGNGYVGIVPIEWNVNGEYVGNEYFRTKLLVPLQPCAEYRFSMYVSLANFSTHGIGKLGAWFSVNNEFTETWLSLLPAPQITGNITPMIDTINWIKVEGTFIANGFEKYLTIGYFKDNVYMDTAFIQDWGSGSAPYYYIDDVSVYKIGEGSSELCNYHIEFPNVWTPNNDGINDVLDVSIYLETIKKIQILNRWGNIVSTLTKDNPIWDGKECADGVYYYIVYFKDYKKQQTGFIHLIR